MLSSDPGFLPMGRIERPQAALVYHTEYARRFSSRSANIPVWRCSFLFSGSSYSPIIMAKVTSLVIVVPRIETSQRYCPASPGPTSGAWRVKSPFLEVPESPRYPPARLLQRAFTPWMPEALGLWFRVQGRFVEEPAAA